MGAFVSRLRVLRRETGLTLRDLARALGTTPGEVANWEMNNMEPDVSIFLKLIDFFDVSADYMLGRTDDRTSHYRKNKYAPIWVLII